MSSDLVSRLLEKVSARAYLEVLKLIAAGFGVIEEDQ